MRNVEIQLGKTVHIKHEMKVGTSEDQPTIGRFARARSSLRLPSHPSYNTPLCEAAMSEPSFSNPTATTILLIDDNDKDRTYYADRIKFYLPDWIVLEAKNGQAGLNLYQSHRVDCIVTELHLPDMSGFELLLELNQQVSEPEVAVIILARMAWKALVDMAKAKGAQAFLVKRSTAGDELIPVIKQAIATVGPTRKRP